MKRQLRPDLAVEVFDKETDERYEITPELEAQIEEFLAQFHKDTKGTNPVGHWFLDDKILEFSKTSPDRIQ